MSNDLIDTKKVKRMINQILKIEQENLKIKKYNNDKMIEKIKKIIETEVKNDN